MWKGNEVGYRALHNWVEKMLGKPSRCSDCGKVGYGRQIHWANVSGKYLRETGDWKRLCANCHGKFDATNGLRINSLTRLQCV